MLVMKQTIYMGQAVAILGLLPRLARIPVWAESKLKEIYLRESKLGIPLRME